MVFDLSAIENIGRSAGARSFIPLLEENSFNLRFIKNWKENL